MTRKLLLPIIALLLSLLLSAKPGHAYPITIGNFWGVDSTNTLAFTASVQAYSPGGAGTVPTVQLVNLRGNGWRAVHSASLTNLPPGISLTISVDANLNLHSVLVTYIDYYTGNNPNPTLLIGTFDSTAYSGPVAAYSFSIAYQLPVTVTTDQVTNPSVLAPSPSPFYVTTGEDTVSKGSIYITQ